LGQGRLQRLDHGIDVPLVYIAEVTDAKDLAVQPLLPSGEYSIILLPQDLEKLLRVETFSRLNRRDRV